MGSVIMVYRILADGPGHIASVRAALEKLGPVSIGEEAIAFGMKALLFKKAIADAGGEQDALEERLAKIPHLSEFEVLSFSRAM